MAATTKCDEDIIRMFIGMREVCDFDIIPTEWSLVGGNRHFRRIMWNQKHPGTDLPATINKCLCGANMTENCYIFHSQYKKMLIVCNDCVQRLVDEEDNRRCVMCFQTHRNTIDLYCSGCRGGLLTAGKYKGKSFRWTLNHDFDYSRCVATNEKYQGYGNLKDFAMWLDNNIRIKTSKRKNTTIDFNAKYKIARRGTAPSTLNTFTLIKVENVSHGYNSSGDDNSTDEILTECKLGEDSGTEEIKEIEEIEEIEEYDSLDNNVNESVDNSVNDSLDNSVNESVENSVNNSLDKSVNESLTVSSLTVDTSANTNVEAIGKQKLGVGKYANCSYEQIYQYHKSYCRWVLNLDDPGSRIADFRHWLGLRAKLARFNTN